MDNLSKKLTTVFVVLSIAMLSAEVTCFASTLDCTGDGISISYPASNGSSNNPVVFTIGGKLIVEDEVVDRKSFHVEKDNDGIDYFIGVEHITKKGNHVFFDRVGTSGPYVEWAIFQGKKYSIKCTYSDNERDEDGPGFGG